MSGLEDVNSVPMCKFCKGQPRYWVVHADLNTPTGPLINVTLWIFSETLLDTRKTTNKEYYQGKNIGSYCKIAQTATITKINRVICIDCDNVIRGEDIQEFMDYIEYYNRLEGIGYEI